MLILREMKHYKTLLNSLHMKTHRAAKVALWVLVFIMAMPLAMVTVSCGHSTEFRINGTIDGFGTGNLRLVFYAYDAVRSVAATAVDGKFMAISRTNRPTVVRVYTSNGTLIGRLIIEGGETVDATFNATDPADMKVSGSKETERLAEFLKNNADAIRANDAPAINEAVEHIVQKNPGWLLSGLLMSDFYDARGSERDALALIAQLEPEVVRAVELAPVRDMLLPLSIPVDSIVIGDIRLFGMGDTLEDISIVGNRATMLMFTDDRSRNADSITAAISIIAESADSLNIIDISADADTMIWHRSVRNSDFKDNRRFRFYWTMSPYNIPGLDGLPVAAMPWFALADSTGRVLYRGSSVSALRKLIADEKL